MKELGVADLAVNTEDSTEAFGRLLVNYILKRKS